MAFNVMNFALGTVIAKQQNVKEPTRIGLIGGIIPGTTGLVLTTVLARQAEKQDATDTSDDGSTVQLVRLDDYEGLPLSTVKPQLEAFGLTVQSQPVLNTGLDAGLISRQQPDPGEEVSVGSTVILSVSADSPVSVEESLPEFIGQSKEEAEKHLKELDLEFVTFSGPSDAPVGQIYMQSPDPGEAIASVHKVTLLVSTGNDGKPTVEHAPVNAAQ
jgi:beta-lactam-binding protein with PASTA domain